MKPGVIVRLHPSDFRSSPMPWYEDWFDSEAYEVVYHERDLVDARRAVALIEAATEPIPGSRLLDVGCGRGRHARLLAARGFRVTGIDLSPNAIATARRRAELERVEVDFRVGDMRELPFEAEFNGVVNLFTSFGFFDDDAEHEQAIAQMARSLVPEGFLFQDYLNAEFAIANLVPEDERSLRSEGLGEVLLRQERWIDERDGQRRINKRIELCCFDHPAGEPDAIEFEESVRLFDLADFRRMYESAGIELLETFGDHQGAPLTPESPRLILYGRRRDR